MRMIISILIVKIGNEVEHMILFNDKKIMENKINCFLHIPKTGGQTLWHILKEQDETYMILHGEYFREFDKPFSYFTMIRNPIDRVISTYYYISSYMRDPLHEQVKKMTIEDFVDHIQEDENEREYAKNDLRSLRLRTANLATRYISGGNASNLEKAKINLNRHFTVIGLTERYLESLYLLKKTYNLSNFTYKKRNITNNRKKIEDIPLKIIDKIANVNRFDIQLYESVKNEFDFKIQNLDIHSKNELNKWISKE